MTSPWCNVTIVKLMVFSFPRVEPTKQDQMVKGQFEAGARFDKTTQPTIPVGDAAFSVKTVVGNKLFSWA